MGYWLFESLSRVQSQRPVEDTVDCLGGSSCCLIAFVFGYYGGLDPVVVASGVVVYAIAISVAIVCKVFRSSTALLIGVVLSFVVSWLAIGSYVAFVKYGDLLSIPVNVASVFVGAAVLLAFVWTAP